MDSQWSAKEFRDWLSWSAFHGAERLFMLTCYLDESERGGADVFVVAGCLFSLPQARKFRRRWHDLFKPYGPAHWTSIYRREGAFARLKNPAESDALMQRGIEIIVDHCEGWVAQGCLTRDVAGLKLGLDGFNSAYALGCWLSIIATDKLNRDAGRPHRAKFVFESGAGGNEEANRLLKILAGCDDKETSSDRQKIQIVMTPEEIDAHKESIGYLSHEFVPKTNCVLLQAADAIAWEASKFEAHTLNSKVAPARNQLKALLKVPHRYASMKADQLREFATKFRTNLLES